MLPYINTRTSIYGYYPFPATDQVCSVLLYRKHIGRIYRRMQAETLLTPF